MLVKDHIHMYLFSIFAQFMGYIGSTVHHVSFFEQCFGVFDQSSQVVGLPQLHKQGSGNLALDHF